MEITLFLCFYPCEEHGTLRSLQMGSGACLVALITIVVLFPKKHVILFAIYRFIPHSMYRSSDVQL
jgi:hypothetical protein